MTLDQLSADATDGLLPCPFCGEAATCENIGDRVDFWMAGCDNNACLTDVAAILPSRDEAIAAWNTRTGQLVAVADDAIERVKAEARDKALDEASEAVCGYIHPAYGELPGEPFASAAIRALKSPKPQEATMSEGVGG